MPKAQKIEANENEIATGVRMEALAREWADKFDPVTQPDVFKFSKMKTELEGGAFVVMFNLMEKFGKSLDDLPDGMGTELEQRNSNNPAIYKIRVIRRSTKGKVSTTVKEVHFKDRLTAQLPSVLGCKNTIAQLERANSDDATVKKDDLPEEIKAMTPHARSIRIGELGKYISQANEKVGNAIDLYQQWQRAKAYPNTSVNLLYAIAEDGKSVCDGQDGRPRVIAPVVKPIVIASTLPGAADMGHKVLCSIGTFKKFQFRSASEKGGTWQNLLDSVPKVAEGEEVPPAATEGVKIETSDRVVSVLNSLASYLDHVAGDTSNTVWSTLTNLIQKTDDDGDEFFYNAAFISALFAPYVASPAGAARYAALRQRWGNQHPTRKAVKAVA